MASGTFWTEQRPRTRPQVVRVAGRDVLLATVGWAAGAIVVRMVGSGPNADYLATFLLAVSVAIAVPLGLLGLIRRNLSWLRRPSDEQSASIVWVVIFVSTAQAATAAFLPYVQGWTAFEAWAALYPLLLLVILLEAAPRFARPTGWTGMRARGGRAVPILLLAGLTACFLVSLLVQDAMVTSGPCDPTVLCVDASADDRAAGLGSVWFAGWSALVVIAFALRLRFIAIAAVAMASFAYGLFVQQIWREIHSRAAVVSDPATLVVAQLIGAMALVGAAAVIQIYEQRERTRQELRVLGWFGAGSARGEG